MPVPYFQFEPFKSDKEIESYFIETATEYVISPSNPGPPGLRNYKALAQCIDYLNSDRNKLFAKIKTYILPNKDELSIFKWTGYVQRKPIAEGCKECAVMYTGHFAIQDKISRDYQKGVLYVLQVENTVHESMVEIRNLPRSGSSLCSISGLGLDLKEDITRALTKEDQCGTGTVCDKVVLVKWSVGDSDVSVTEYTKDSLN
jgi:hypothetical protein